MGIKKALLLISGLVTAILVLISIFGTYSLCNNVGTCINASDFFYIHSLPVLVFFFLALITYFLRQEIYNTWFRFARIWIPLSMLAIFLAPEYSHDWMFPIEKGTVALFSSALFVIISLGLICYKKFWSTK